MASPPANASVRDGYYFDILIGTTAGTTAPALLDGTPLATTDLSSSLGVGFGGRAGIGLAKSDYFTELNIGLSMMDIASHGQGIGATVGITVGYTLPMIPMGLSVGIDFVDSYSSNDGEFSAGGYTARAGINYFVKESFKLTAEVSRHTYTALTAGAVSTTPDVGFTTAGIYAGFPIPWSLPKTSWRKPRAYRDGIEASGYSQTELSAPPSAEMPPDADIVPAPEPEIAPPPSGDPNASFDNPGDNPGDAPLEDPLLAAPPTADPAIPAPEEGTVPEGSLPPLDEGSLPPPPEDGLSAPPSDLPSDDLPPADLPPADGPTPPADSMDLPPPPM